MSRWLPQPRRLPWSLKRCPPKAVPRNPRSRGRWCTTAGTGEQLWRKTAAMHHDAPLVADLSLDGWCIPWVLFRNVGWWCFMFWEMVHDGLTMIEMVFNCLWLGWLIIRMNQSSLTNYLQIPSWKLTAWPIQGSGIPTGNWLPLFREGLARLVSRSETHQSNGLEWFRIMGNYDLLIMVNHGWRSVKRVVSNGIDGWLFGSSMLMKHDDWQRTGTG